MQNNFCTNNIIIRLNLDEFEELSAEIEEEVRTKNRTENTSKTKNKVRKAVLQKSSFNTYGSCLCSERIVVCKICDVTSRCQAQTNKADVKHRSGYSSRCVLE